MLDRKLVGFTQRELDQMYRRREARLEMFGMTVEQRAQYLAKHPELRDFAEPVNDFRDFGGIGCERNL